MSELVSTLIKAAFRVIGVTASGETPTDGEMADGLEALKFMLRHWSNSNTRIYYTTKDTLTLNGATSYTIGSGGDCNTVRPDERCPFGGVLEERGDAIEQPEAGLVRL